MNDKTMLPEQLAEIVIEDRGKRKTKFRAMWDVLRERRRQTTELGWTAEHDDEHGFGHLIRLAQDRLSRAYTAGQTAAEIDSDTSAARAQLVKAAALCLAAIDLIDRQEEA